MTILPATTPGKFIAHRGASIDAPENTLEAYALAADLGFGWIEVDCQITSDHVPVMMHDFTLNRTTNGQGYVVGTSFEKLRSLNASAGHARAEGLRVPTLEETLDLVLKRNLGVVLEIKPVWGRDLEHARAVATVVRDKWHSFDENLIISSFSRLCLQEIRRLLPDVPLAMACEILPELPQDYIDRLGICGFHVFHEGLSSTSVARALATGAHISAATVNDPLMARRFIDMGATVMTDSAEVLREIRS